MIRVLGLRVGEDAVVAGSSTACTSGESGTMMATTSASLTACSMDSAAPPPASTNACDPFRGSVVSDDGRARPRPGGVPSGRP